MHHISQLYGKILIIITQLPVACYKGQVGISWNLITLLQQSEKKLNLNLKQPQGWGAQSATALSHQGQLWRPSHGGIQKLNPSWTLASALKLLPQPHSLSALSVGLTSTDKHQDDLFLQQRLIFHQDNNRTQSRYQKSDFRPSFWMSLSDPQPWIWLIISGGMWKWLCTNVCHPTWWSLKSAAKSFLKTGVPSLWHYIQKDLRLQMWPKCINKDLSRRPWTPMLMWFFFFFVMLTFSIYFQKKKSHCPYGVCRVLWGKNVINQLWNTAII